MDNIFHYDYKSIKDQSHKEGYASPSTPHFEVNESQYSRGINDSYEFYNNLSNFEINNINQSPCAYEDNKQKGHPYIDRIDETSQYMFQNKKGQTDNPFKIGILNSSDNFEDGGKIQLNEENNNKYCKNEHTYLEKAIHHENKSLESIKQNENQDQLNKLETPKFESSSGNVKGVCNNNNYEFMKKNNIRYYNGEKDKVSAYWEMVDSWNNTPVLNNRNLCSYTPKISYQRKDEEEKVSLETRRYLTKMKNIRKPLSWRKKF